MPAFLIDPDQIQDHRLSFSTDEAHHLRGRRIRQGEIVDAIDGQGTSYRIRLVLLDGNDAIGEIVEQKQEHAEGQPYLHLAVAMMKGQRFDTVVEKATEIGVHTIQPLLTERGVVRGEGKLERWERIAQAAAKQCGRSHIPEIAKVMEFDSVVTSFAERELSLLVADPGADGSLEENWVPDSRCLALFIGPEGGFHPRELTCLDSQGACSFMWGHHILRADTAAIVLSALVIDRAFRHTGQVSTYQRV